MGKGWTEERRKKQAERCRTNKPWEKSTGPKSPKGKAIASMNALKRGEHSQYIREYNKVFALNREFLKQMWFANQVYIHHKWAANRLKEVRLKSKGLPTPPSLKLKNELKDFRNNPP